MSDVKAGVQVHEPGPSLDIIASGGSARAVIWPAMGASLRSMHRISLGAGGRTVELEHPSEAVYYLMSGSGSVRDSLEVHTLRMGSMFLVEAGTSYVIKAGAEGAELVGGPCPPDPSLYSGLMPSSAGGR
jgi:quercetin dioxygenase-like cupin family protein